MSRRIPYKLAAAAAAVALLVTACGGGDDGGDTEGTGGNQSTANPDQPSGGTYSINLTEPQFLAPSSNCYESECSKVLSAINDPVVSIDRDTGELVYDGLAESITPNDDQSVWTIKLKDGRTFQNGEPVNADKFIQAWNYSSNPKNEQQTAGFMSHIQGAGKGETMSGLKKVDDLTFEVTLTGPFSQFGTVLTYAPAWAPIADECLADVKACNEQPIGTGPYQMDGPWRHDEGITVTKWADYNGEKPGQADTIEFKMFSDMVAAFRAYQGGQLDVLDALEPTIYQEGVNQAGDRMVQTENSSLTYMGFPTKTAPFDNADYRRAVSLSIDRQAIIDAVLNGQAKPSTDIVVPVIPGSRDDACEYCVYDPDQAKEVFAKTSGSTNDTVELWFNSGSGHEGWVEAIGNSMKNSLGINFKMKGTEWAQYLNLLGAHEFTGPFRLGWSMDYPSPENYIRPIVGTNGDSNYSQYSNKELDALLVKGDQAATTEEAFKYYQQAGDIALSDMPILPLWSGVNTTVWSENVDNVVYDGMDGQVLIREVTVNQ